MARIAKAQKGKDVPKGYVRGEMTGRLIPEKEYNKRQSDMAKSLQEMKDQYKKDTTKAKPAPKKAAVAPKKSMKNGGKQMIKRADGSYSQRGLWDNIRANKGSGKKPTAQMLKQEKKINSKKK